MATLIFAEQRNSDGDAVFANQVQEATLAISATLQSDPTITAVLTSVFEDIATTLVSVSNITASLQLIETRLIATISGDSNLISTLSALESRMRANLSSDSSLGGTLMLLNSKMAAVMLATSSATAALKYVVVPPVSVSASLTSGASVWAKLYTNLESKIPKGTLARAVPTDNESIKIIRYRGDTYPDSFIIFDDKTGLTLDISGQTFRMAVSKVKNPASSSDILYTMFGVADDPENGLVYFSPTESQADRVGYFYYDLEMRDSSGVVRTLLSSSYVYKQDITK